MMNFSRFSSRKTAIWLAAASAFMAAGAGAFLFFRAHRGLELAKTALRGHDFGEARRQLGRYLGLHPNDAQARLLLAEAYARDDELTIEESVKPAIEALQKIPPEAPEFAQAQLQEGRLTFLILHQPARAEVLFRAAIERSPETLDAHFLLWRVLDMTGRQALSFPVFWDIYELTPENAKAPLLRDWYMSEFYTDTLSVSFDVQMNFARPGATSDHDVVYRRLISFREQEPDSAVTHAALADWFRQQGDLKHAHFLIRQTPKQARGQDDPYYLSTLVAIHFDLGKFEDARQIMANWPAPHEGYWYWRWKGIVDEEIANDDRAAVIAYDKALETAPGKVDWQLLNRKGQCLERLMETEKAEAVRKQARIVESLMETKPHERLRAALANLEDPKGLGAIVEFYQALGRTREAEAWNRHFDWLKKTSSAGSPKPSLPPQFVVP